MDKETLDNWCERSILGLVLGILIFAPLAFGAVDAWAFLVVQALTIGVMLMWALRLWISPRPQILWPPLCWVVLAFTIYAVARYLTADIEYVARQEMIQVLMYAFLFLAIVNNLYRQEYSQAISFTLVFVAMGISAYAVFQFFTHSDRVWNLVAMYPGRGTGTYISPNNLVCFLEMILPLTVAYLLAGRVQPVTRILLGYSALIILAGIAVTFSRGGWVACMVATLALIGVLIFNRHHRLPALLLLVVLLGGGGVFFAKYLTHTASYVQRVGRVLNEESAMAENLDLRRDLWVAAGQMWRDNFWCGAGPAHFNYVFPQYRPGRIQMQPDRAHNDYLNLLADWGTVGGIIALGGMTVFCVGLWQTRKNVRRAENQFKGGYSNRHAFFLGASAGLLALAVHSVVDFNLHIPANALVGVTLLALLSSNLRFATEKYWVNLRLPLKLVMTGVLVAGIVYLTGQEFRHGRETFWLARAGKLSFFAPERPGALEKAFTAEPQNFATAYEIGECYRIQSFDGARNYADLAHTAMDWYSRGMKLNSHDGYNYLRYGMCLDWLERHAEAGSYFDRADALDPNNYFNAANIGWHYVQIEDYAAARPWLMRSVRLQWKDNQIARSYLDLAEQKLRDNAAGKNNLPPGF
ncbi:MAG: O-antigen ligase family protein [Limisphaerales bacterium]